MASKIYVGNLSYQLTEEMLSDHFGDCGTVTSVTIIKDRDTGRSKGFAFVEFAEDDACDAAIAKNGSDLGGRPTRVSKAHEREQRRPRSW